MLVTAAAGTGIGFATAKRCVEEGARVVISDKHERRLGESADASSACPAMPCDVTHEDDVQRLFAAASTELGGIDVLVNNAGLGGTAQLARDDRRAVVVGARRHAQRHDPHARAPRCSHMTRAGRGAIVNNASVVGWRAQEGQAHYAAAKAGVMALTRCAAIEAAAARRARRTRSRRQPRDARAPRQGDHRGAARRARPPARRSAAAAEPWEVANVIVFLASRLLVVHDRRDRLASAASTRNPTHPTCVDLTGVWTPAADAGCVLESGWRRRGTGGVRRRRERRGWRR